VPDERLADRGAFLDVHNRSVPSSLPEKRTCGPATNARLVMPSVDSHWVNGRAGYRCRHGHNSARPVRGDRLGNLYVREDTLLAELLRGLATGSDEPDVTGAEVVAHLRSRAVVIVQDRAGCRLVARDEL
jgi:hypothetical protein